jgi:acyl dehydratase
MPTMRQRAAAGIQPGDTFTVSRTFSRQDCHQFGRITRDYNPVHYDPGFARNRGLPGVISHGLLTGALLCEIGGQVAWLASSMEFRFLKPVFFGDTVTCRVTVTEVDSKGRAAAEASMVNQEGREVVTARITGLVPTGRSREDLGRMLAEGDPTNPLGGEG